MPASESLSWPWRFSHWPVGPNYKTCVLAWDPRVIFGNLILGSKIVLRFIWLPWALFEQLPLPLPLYPFSPLYLGFIAQAWDRNKVEDKYIFYFQNRVSNLISLGLLHPRVVHPAYRCACLLVVVAGQSVHLCKQFCFTQFACHPAHTPGHNMLAKYLPEEEKITSSLPLVLPPSPLFNTNLSRWWFEKRIQERRKERSPVKKSISKEDRNHNEGSNHTSCGICLQKKFCFKGCNLFF